MKRKHVKAGDPISVNGMKGVATPFEEGMVTEDNKLFGTMSNVNLYPWCLRKHEQVNIYTGKTEVLNAKRDLINALQREIDERLEAIETIKKI